MNILIGYRTYICSVLGVLDVAAMGFGLISPEIGLFALSILGFGSIAALRAALTNESLDLETRIAARYNLPKFAMPEDPTYDESNPKMGTQ